MTKGYIYSIETFGTLDGPGIRFIVFFQGCPLKCKYCHNRDTWEQTEGREVTIDKLMDELEKYKDIYQNSGGGVTASGGEPALQADFVAQFFAKVKETGLNTVLNTSGFIDAEKAEKMLSHTDLVILDIKHSDIDDHKELTGVENDKIITFAHYLTKINKPVWIRQVLIPGINTNEAQLKKLAEFIKEMPNVELVELLGYHKMGSHKWNLAGCADPLEDTPATTEEEVEKAKDFLCGQGIDKIR